MAYIYRFKDINNRTIYVGKTAQTLDKRIAQHFTKGHLPVKCYKSIARIEYQKYKTESDALVMETYYITKYDPKYNTLQKSKDIPTLELDTNEWKTYKVYKEIKPPDEIKFGFIQKIFFIYFLYVLIKFVADMLQ